MKGLYIGFRRRSDRKDKLRQMVNFLCRCGLVLSFIVFIAIWADMEFRPLMIGQRLLWTAMDGILIFGFLLGDAYTVDENDYIEEELEDE